MSPAEKQAQAVRTRSAADDGAAKTSRRRKAMRELITWAYDRVLAETSRERQRQTMR